MPVSPVTPQTAAPAAKQPGQASSAPMGQSQATQPTANRGSEAQALQQVAAAIKFLEQAMTAVGAASEMGKKIHKSLGGLIDLAPSGAVSPQGEKNAMQNQAMQMAQQNRAMMQARMQGQGGQQGGQPQQQGMAA
jgi:hypothetical protein